MFWETEVTILVGRMSKRSLSKSVAESNDGSDTFKPDDGEEPASNTNKIFEYCI